MDNEYDSHTNPCTVYVYVRISYQDQLNVA